ncbi:MAG TPA: hypothetical protein VHI98_04125 [Vicinamibacterales bacterium]|nr:hypothetical protein [Vicinamibacterales bacterium]HEX2462768.1 hypothetical protein [Vicinamibacterales bacterium]
MTIDDIVSVPSIYESRRKGVAEAVAAALDIVYAFAAEQGWSSYVKEPFFRGVEIFETQDALWRRMLQLNQLEDAPRPTDALTAALESGVLLAVVPEEAEAARPEYFRSPDDWVRALAHEIIHRLHVRVLNGNEDAMGPQWFFEALAVLGSGQSLGEDIRVDSVEQSLELTRTGGRGSYGRYAAALRFLVKRIPLQRIIDNAAAADFEEWLRTESEKSNV